MNKHLQQRDAQSIWHPFTPSNSEPPLPVISAEKSLLHLEDGSTLIDAISSWWVMCHGHRHPHITEKINEQLQTLHHVIFSGFTHEPAITLAERVLKLLPHCRKVFFSDNGSTAVEVALKMAIQYWFNRGESRRKIIALEGGYHGDTFGAMSTGARDLFVRPFEKYLFEVLYLPFPNSSAQWESEIEQMLSGEDVAAVIIEPLVQGVNGMRMYSATSLEAILSTARRCGIPVIGDEIFTGFGKTGKYFSNDYTKTKADIVCLSKGLTGGTLPLGLTLCTREIYTAFEDTPFEKTFFHGHSFTGNPLACAAANASLDLFEKPETWRSIERIENSHKNFVENITSHPKISNPRSLGAILALDVVTEGPAGYTNPIRQKIISRAREKGVLLRPLGNMIYAIPPFCITDSELSEVYNAIYFALEGV